MNQNIQIIPFTGNDVAPLIPDIARLRIEVFAEYPFLYDGDLEYEERYLAKFSKITDAIVVAAFDGKSLVGVSTGYPFIYESKELQDVFSRSGKNPNDYFCYGESVLSKPYRGKGIGKAFYLEREKHVKNLGHPFICFFTSKRPANDPKRPADYRPLTDFWKQWNFCEHPELTAQVSYKEIGETNESLKEMVFWIKTLK